MSRRFKIAVFALLLLGTVSLGFMLKATADLASIEIPPETTPIIRQDKDPEPATTTLQSVETTPTNAIQKQSTPAYSQPTVQPQPSSDKSDGECTGRETAGRCADKCPPGTYKIGNVNDDGSGAAICKAEPTGCPYGDSIPMEDCAKFEEQQQ